MRSKIYGVGVTASRVSIHDFAADVGLSVHTLRYYERIGLLDPVERAPSGHRRYSGPVAEFAVVNGPPGGAANRLGRLGVEGQGRATVP